MATTAQQVFELAMSLMDELNESSGSADTADTYAVEEPGKRPICPEITGFTTALPLDDGICQGVLPYGLAAHLLLGEDDDKASYFNQRYEEKLAQLRNTPAAWEDITDLYGGIEYGQFGRW